MADIEAMPKGDEELKTKNGKKALFKLYYKYLYMWQKLTDEDSPSGALKTIRAKL